MKRILLPLLAIGACLVARLHGADPPPVLTLPPSLITAGTSTIINGQPWAYVVWNAGDPAWLATRDVAVHMKPEVGGAFELQGVMPMMTDPAAIAPWIQRAAALGEDLGECAAIAAMLHSEWQDPAAPEPLPAGLAERLSVLGGRAAQVPSAADALYQLGNSRPLFRLVSGTGWCGPMKVANGAAVVIELRERDQASGAEGGVVGRLTLTAGAADVLAQPGAPVQVPPDFLQALPPASESPLPVPRVSEQTDLGVALRWPIPEALRRQLLLTRGFHAWRVETGYTPPGGLNGPALLAAETSDPARVRRLNRGAVAASKVFTDPAAPETGPMVNDFAADRSTWFVVDDNNRYATGADPEVVTGIPYTEGQSFDYVVAPVDLLGRIGPVSQRGSGVAVHTVPPPVPEVMRVENIMKNGGQRLRVAWKPTAPAAGAVPTTHYLVYRDRVKNTPPSPIALERSAHPSGRDDLIYLGTVLHPPEPGATLNFDDDALVPQPSDFGQTYFYCIRAAHLGPLGYCVSAPSPAAFGTLRDRAGPSAPEGYTAADCPRLGIRFDQTGPEPEFLGRVDVAPEQIVLRFEGNRGTEDGRWRDVDWAFFWVINLDDPGDWSHFSPRLHFGRGDLVWTELTLPLSTQGYDVIAMAGNSAGRISHMAQRFVYEVSGGHRYRIGARVIGAPTIAMAPPGLPFEEYWEPYFAGGPVAITPVASTPETFRANFPAEPSGASRALLVQQQTASAGWINADTARLPAGQSQFFFGIPNPNNATAWRVWEILDPPGSPDPGDCSHNPRPADADAVSPVKVVLTLPPGAREYRIYRRIDEGPLTLLRQDAETWDDSSVQAVMLSDALIPLPGGRIGYYGQVFDEHGNPSPLALLGEKVTALPELPVPTMEPAGSAGTLAAPQMIVRAFCPSPGVARIELSIDPPPGPSPPLTATTKSGSQLFNAQVGGSDPQPADFTVSLFSGMMPEQDPSVPVVLESVVNIQPAVKYKVQVRAIGPTGNAGEWSTQQVFTWSPPLVGESVAWPARPIPKLVTWNPVIKAFRLLPEHFNLPPFRALDKYPPAQYPVAIRLGRIPVTSALPREYDPASNWDVRGVRIPQSGYVFEIGYFGVNNATGFLDPTPDPRLMHQFLAPRLKQYGDITAPDFSQKLLPIVLYRRQTARMIEGTSVPTPDTDIIQASSMIHAIAWRKDPPVSPDLALFIDPFVSVAVLEPAVTPLAADLCLFDTSPVAAGATYQYYLVHFGEDGEPDAVINAGTLTFPEAP